MMPTYIRWDDMVRLDLNNIIDYNLVDRKQMWVTRANYRNIAILLLLVEFPKLMLFLEVIQRTNKDGYDDGYEDRYTFHIFH